MVANTTSLTSNSATVVPPSPTHEPRVMEETPSYCMPTGVEAPVLSPNDPPHDPTQPVRVACKARGIKDHTPSTAYLEIPANPTHGLVLMCSHPECQSTNRRFRYCAVCQQPVAKRNFIKRHNHGLLIDKGGRTIFPSDGEAYEEEVQQMPPAKRPRITHPEVHKDQAKKRPRCDSPVSSAPVPVPLPVPVTAAAPAPLPLPVAPVAPPPAVPPQDFVVSFPAPVDSANQVPTSIVIPSSMLEAQPSALVPPPAPLSQVSADESCTDPGQLTSKERIWLELLHKRPTNPHDDSMCKWIKNVLEASQPSSAPAPVPQAPTAPPTSFYHQAPQPAAAPRQPTTDEMMEELLRGGDCDDELRDFLVTWDAPVTC